MIVAFTDFLNNNSKDNPPDDDEGWININTTTWTPERPGDTIEGELLEKKYSIGKYNKNIYVILRGDGCSRDVWGCYRLDKKMDEIKVGDIIRIRFKGTITKSDGNTMYDYDVLKKIIK